MENERGENGDVCIDLMKEAGWHTVSVGLLCCLHVLPDFVSIVIYVKNSIL
jgi:hypothetical protein